MVIFCFNPRNNMSTRDGRIAQLLAQRRASRQIRAVGAQPYEFPAILPYEGPNRPALSVADLHALQLAANDVVAWGRLNDADAVGIGMSNASTPGMTTPNPLQWLPTPPPRVFLPTPILLAPPIPPRRAVAPPPPARRESRQAPHTPMRRESLPNLEDLSLRTPPARPQRQAALRYTKDLLREVGERRLARAIARYNTQPEGIPLRIVLEARDLPGRFVAGEPIGIPPSLRGYMREQEQESREYLLSDEGLPALIPM